MAVCIIDDNTLLLDALKLALEDEGYCVFTAQNWPDAEMHLAANDVDAVVTDLEMPHLKGAEIVARVRARFTHMPIIAMSGSTDAQIGDKARANGASTFFSKPVSGRVIAEALKAMMQMPRAAR